MNLQYPFDIYIDRTYSVRMTPELDEAIERLIAREETPNVKANAQVVASGYYNDLKKLVEGAPFSSLRLLVSSTDIYNKGRAITKEALEAYIKETKGTRFFFKKVIRA
jgi:predicted DNA-binding protein